MLYYPNNLSVMGQRVISFRSHLAVVFHSKTFLWSTQTVCATNPVMLPLYDHLIPKFSMLRTSQGLFSPPAGMPMSCQTVSFVRLLRQSRIYGVQKSCHFIHISKERKSSPQCWNIVPYCRWQSLMEYEKAMRQIQDKVKVRSFWFKV